MKFAELVESLDLPQTQVAERAWEDGRRRVRRRRGAIAAGASTLAVACILGVIGLTRPDHATTPTPMPHPPMRSVEPRTAPLVQDLLTHGRWRAELGDMDYRRFSGNLDRAVPLSQDPVDRAALAMADPDDEAGAFVLGEDGRWRRVDVPGLVAVHHSGSYTSPALRPTALSPDATRLALPQPNALVVVDLTTATHHRYEVPGPGNTYAIWVDASHVLVVQGGAQHGTMVDLRDGSRSPSPYGPSTRFFENDNLTWGRGDELLLHSVLKWGDGRSVRTEATNSAGFFPQPPLVRNDVVVGDGGVYYDRNNDLPVNTLGITVVDGSNGKVLAYLPLEGQNAYAALLLGWDGDRPVIGVPIPEESGGLFVFAWDWEAGALDPIGHVTGMWTSWGTGQVRE
jgi:hypothetical protein